MSLAGHNLTIGYSDRVVGRGLNVALKQGEVLALLGPNGGGKTTLLKTLLGILASRRGGDRRTLARWHFHPGTCEADRLCAASACAHLRFHCGELGADGPHRSWQSLQSAVDA
jgi:energy-coupling factor transporter ATP-binding protein EcfA2